MKHVPLSQSSIEKRRAPRDTVPGMFYSCKVTAIGYNFTSETGSGRIHVVEVESNFGHVCAWSLRRNIFNVTGFFQF